MMQILLGMFVAIIVLLVKVYRGRKTSGKIIFKLILALLSIIFTIAMVICCLEQADDYRWAKETYSLEGRLEIARERRDDNDMTGLRNTLTGNECYEPEFEEFWAELVAAEKQNIARLQ